MRLLEIIISEKAQAYLDPGSGSILIQMIVAALAGAAVAIGVFGKKVKRWWFKLLGKEIAEDETFDDEA